MKISLEKANFAVSVLTLIALAVGGIWVFYQYELSGATGWTTNITVETKVSPYRDNFRLLVVHVKTKNPRSYTVELNTKLGDSFELHVRKMPMDAKENAVIDENEGEVIKIVNLMQSTGGKYEFFPGAEMDDMCTFVLPINTIVTVNAEMKIHNGTTDEHGKPDTDFVSASAVVHVEP